MVAGAATIPFQVLAWLYVLLRVAHACIHTGRNDLTPRIAVYFASWATLLCMWGLLAIAPLVAGTG